MNVPQDLDRRKNDDNNNNNNNNNNNSNDRGTDTGTGNGMELNPMHRLPDSEVAKASHKRKYSHSPGDSYGGPEVIPALEPEAELELRSKSYTELNSELNQLDGKPVENGKLEKGKRIKLLAVPHSETQTTATPNKTFDRTLKKTSDINGSNCCDDIQRIIQRVMLQLNGELDLRGNSSLKEIYSTIYNVFFKAVIQKESHSILLVGPKGCGKSTIVEQALTSLDKIAPDAYIRINLHSSIHTDDREALREVARQLDRSFSDFSGSKGNFTEKVLEQKSINDTLANILQVLGGTLSGSESTERQWIPLVFIIDEIEKFATSNRQTLLYNLLDLCQNSQVPISVIGLTSKLNAKESLEKRVSSRFSQRTETIVFPHSFEEFVANAKLHLLLDDEYINLLELPKLGLEWNEQIERVFGDKTSKLAEFHMREYHTTRNYRVILDQYKIALSGVSMLSGVHKTKDVNALGLLTLNANFASRTGSVIREILLSLSTVELFILIAAVRWLEKYDTDVINFSLAFLEYIQMQKLTEPTNSFSSGLTTSIQVEKRLWTRELLRNSWRNLYRVGILVDPQTTGGDVSHGGDSRSSSTVLEENTMVVIDITLDELSAFVLKKPGLKKYLRLS